jgi:CheY-like chemotaxis protein
MYSIRLIHWQEEETIEKARILKEAGFEVFSDPPAGSRFFKALESENPDAFVIDLSRIPSQGRDIAVAIRRRKGTRHIPIIFIGGNPTKVEQIKRLLPDARYAGWDDAIVAIEKAIEASTNQVMVPESVFAAYAGKSLVAKLGISAGSKVAHVKSPNDFITTLGTLPPRAVLISNPDEIANLVIWFVRSIEQLGADLASIVDASKRSPVWIAWPKRGSSYEGDLTQQVVREKAMRAGLVDYKICAIDRNWSALLFTWRGVVE